MAHSLTGPGPATHNLRPLTVKKRQSIINHKESSIRKRMQKEEFYMRRALQLAANGAGHVSPNPMVGAVIVEPSGKIIGEGWHRRYGGPHAEVNAFRSVRQEDEHLIPESTIFVTLEPCSHYGKTPPCALLLKEKGIRRAVIGTGDPNPKVAGRGIRILREAGIEVVEDVLKDECIWINRRFMTAQLLRRPWIQLKWAQTADGEMKVPADAAPDERLIISTPLTMTLMHRERAMTDAIMVGTGTLLADNPSLTTRLWPGRNPRPVIFASPRIAAGVDSNGAPLKALKNAIILDPKESLERNMHKLYEEYGITSLMVEGGPTLLHSFIAANLYDEQRIETSSARKIF